jgi:hypothetical protein
LGGGPGGHGVGMLRSGGGGLDQLAGWRIWGQSEDRVNPAKPTPGDVGPRLARAEDAAGQ